MIRAVGFVALSLWAAAALPALADKQRITASRHPTAKERRATRAKIVGQMKQDGFGPVPRIVGGRPAADGEYPWMVGLIDAAEPDEFDGLFCGGSLIHPHWVLTAAHCVLGSRAEDIEVLVGASNLANPGAGARRIAVAEIIQSPAYNDFTMDADFALLRLSEPASGTVIPVIDDRDYETPGAEAIVTGWGDTTNGQGVYPNQLQEVELPVIDLDVANATPAYDGTLTANMLAAGLAEGGKDSCQGDSGGPLIVPSEQAPGWMQAGVVSFGNGCAEAGAYGIYTRIGNFRDFITGHIRPNYAAWERENGRRGERLDPDENGRTNFEEWALPDGGEIDKEIDAGFLYLRYRRPDDAPEAEFVLEHASTVAGPWVPAGGVVLGLERLGDGSAYAVHRFPQSADTGVYRVRVEFSGELAHGDRPLGFPGAITGRLGDLDRIGSSRRYQTYGLTFPSGTGPVAISLRSADLKARLQLQALGIGGGTVEIDRDGGGGVGGTDEWHEFTPEEGRRYRIWVTTTDAAEVGAFELNVFDPVALAAMPPLAGPSAAALGGTLAAGDEVDPYFLPGSTYFKDDFRIDAAVLAPGRLLEIRMKSKGNAAKGIDDFLSLIDAESGRLITGNDTFAGKANDAGLRFVPVPGKAYLLRASSSAEQDTGLYQLFSSAPVPGAKKSGLGAIASGGGASGKLSASSELDERYFTFKYDYLLSPSPGDRALVLTLESVKFDAYLMVLDANNLAVVAEGDSGGPAGGRDNARLEFTARAGRSYLIRATTYDRFEKGAYLLKVAAAP